MSTRLGIQRTSAIVAGAWLNRPDVRNAEGDALAASGAAHFCLSEARLGLLPGTLGPGVVRALGEPASRRCFSSAERTP